MCYTWAMSIFIAKGGRGGKYYVLKETTWDKKTKAQRQHYLCYLGAKKVLPLAKAKAICKKLGITLDELRKVRGLKIIEE